MTIPMQIAVNAVTIPFGVSANEIEIPFEIGYSVGAGYPVYTGETEVTPTQETQVLSTAGTSVLNDIVINPIPSNYGLITWNGLTLTVS